MRLAYLIVLFLSVILLSPMLKADSDNDRAKILLERGQIISLEDLLANIRQHVNNTLKLTPFGFKTPV